MYVLVIGMLCLQGNTGVIVVVNICVVVLCRLRWRLAFVYLLFVVVALFLYAGDLAKHMWLLDVYVLLRCIGCVVSSVEFHMCCYVVCALSALDMANSRLLLSV